MPLEGPNYPKWMSRYPSDSQSPQKRNPSPWDWSAPEHYRLAQDMRRDYPRDDRGMRLPGSSRQLVVDPRPTVLKPERKKIFLTDQALGAYI